jgi:hypothetical protein
VICWVQSGKGGKWRVASTVDRRFSLGETTGRRSSGWPTTSGVTTASCMRRAGCLERGGIVLGYGTGAIACLITVAFDVIRVENRAGGIGGIL